MNEELKVIISAEISELKQGVQNAKKEVEGFSKSGKTSLKDWGNALKSAGDTCKKGMAVVGGALAAGATALVGLAKATEEYRANSAKLETTFTSAGASAETAKNTYNDLYRVLGDNGQATEAAAHLAKLTTEEKALNEWTTICQGVYATFGDSLPIEGLTEAANETAKVGQVTGGLADALNWAGISEDDFNAKLEKCNTEAEREKLIRETLSGVYNEAAANYEETAAGVLAQNEAQASLDETLAKLGETMAPVVTAFTEFAAQIMEKVTPAIQSFMDEHGEALAQTLTDIADAIGAVITWIADNWDVIAPIAAVITGIAVALGVFSTAMGIVNTVMAVSPVTWIILGIVAAIAALVAIIVVVIKHWDEIKETVSKVVNIIKEKVNEMVEKVTKFFSDLKEKVTKKVQELKEKAVAKFNEIKQGIQDKIQAAKDAVVNKFQEIKQGITDKIQAAKESVTNKFNEIKSNITSKINAIKTSVTTTMNNVKTALTKPVEKARDLIKGIVDKIKGFFSFTINFPHIKLPHFTISPSGWSVGDLLKGSIPKLGISWYAKGGVFDKPTLFSYGNGALGGLGENGAEAVVPLEKNTQWLTRVAEMLAARMGTNQPVVLQVDGKTFAQISVDSINQLTKQTGKLPLKIM